MVKFEGNLVVISNRSLDKEETSLLTQFIVVCYLDGVGINHFKGSESDDMTNMIYQRIQRQPVYIVVICKTK